jgi:hypothetical protein
VRRESASTTGQSGYIQKRHAPSLAESSLSSPMTGALPFLFRIPELMSLLAVHQELPTRRAPLGWKFWWKCRALSEWKYRSLLG